MTDENLPVVHPRHTDCATITADHVQSMRGGDRTVIIRGERDDEWVEGVSVDAQEWR